MKRIFTALGAFALALTLSLSLLVSPACAAEEASEMDAVTATGYLVLLVDPPATLFSADPLQQATLSAALDERSELLPIAEEMSIYRVEDMAEIQNLVYAGQVAIVEPDYPAELFSVPASPNDHYFTDTYYNYQFNLKGTDSTGANGIHVQSAWDVGLTGEGVTVAVIDSGLNAEHIDGPAKVAHGRYFYFKEEENGRYAFEINGVKRYYGYYSSDYTSDDIGHGTMVTGIIAAKANNASSSYSGGIAGIAPEVTIIPIKCFTNEEHQVLDPSTGQVITENHLGGQTSNLISGINHAVKYGADIINMSWGIRADSATLKVAITNAYNAGVILVAAVGNDGPSGTLQYPASYPTVIGVSSTDKSGYLSDFAQRNTYVDVCAPGGKRSGQQIYSLGYSSATSIARGDGTSLSSPAVVGAIALLKQADPDLTQSDFLALLDGNCDAVQVNTASDAQYTGRGLLNIHKLLDAVGYSSVELSNQSDGSVSVRAALHPRSPLPSSVYTMLGAYNDGGHLLDVLAGSASYDSTYGTYTFNGSFDLPTATSVQAFCLDPNSGYAPLYTPAAAKIIP